MNWLTNLFSGTANQVVVYKPTALEQGVEKFSEYYCVDICPNCKSVLDHDKARYKTRCCYKCGHKNDAVLFDTESVVVRDRYVNGKFIETIVKD